MNRFLKRTGALLLTLTILLASSACTRRTINFDKYDDYHNDEDDTPQTTQKVNHDSEYETEKIPDVTTTKKEESNTPTIPDNDPATNSVVKATELSDPNLRYVMIYNPKVYNENSNFDNSSLKLGHLGSQIDINTNRGDGLEENEDEVFTQIAQDEWLKYLPEEIELEGDRADPLGTDYSKGETKKFYINTTLSLENRIEQDFICSYAGEYCYIWSINGKVNQNNIEDLGREFDTKIYKEVSNTFGTPRFVGESGKVNILLFSMQSNLLGYFTIIDLFTAAEIPQVGLSGIKCNTGNAIININSDMLKNPQYKRLAYSTLAHELQHCINSTAAISTGRLTMMNTWLNEGMSGYIETELYQESKDLSGHYTSFNQSSLIRNGQSLYNFDSNYTDIGVYGSVYHYSKYIEKLAGKSIFKSIMDYWRESYSRTLCTSEALTKSVSKSVYNDINNSINYSALNMKFDSATDEWMSKLTLNFYLSSLSNDKNIAAFNKIECSSLLYDNISTANIEGGGRIIVSLNKNTFKIPSDSDKGLIYVGLDKDFKPITNFICQ